MSQLSPDITYARASIRSLKDTYTLGTQAKPFGGVIIANTKSYSFLDSGGSVLEILKVFSDDVTYLYSKAAKPIAISPEGVTRWNFEAGGDLSFKQSSSIRAATTDSTDAFILSLTGAGGLGADRGALIEIGGNESSITGSLNLSSGNVASSHIYINSASSNGEIRFLTASSEKWRMLPYGDLYSTNANIRLLGTQKSIALPSVAGVSMSGVSQADATELNTAVSTITSGSIGGGVKFWDAWDGTLISVANRSGTDAKLYPHNGASTINGAGAGAGITIGNNQMAVCFRQGSNWMCLVGAAPIV